MIGITLNIVFIFFYSNQPLTGNSDLPLLHHEADYCIVRPGRHHGSPCPERRVPPSKI